MSLGPTIQTAVGHNSLLARHLCTRSLSHGFTANTFAHVLERYYENSWGLWFPLYTSRPDYPQIECFGFIWFLWIWLRCLLVVLHSGPGSHILREQTPKSCSSSAVLLALLWIWATSSMITDLIEAVRITILSTIWTFACIICVQKWIELRSSMLILPMIFFWKFKINSYS